MPARLTLVLACFLALPLSLPPAAQAAGGAPATAPSVPQTPEQIAADYYNNGLRSRNRAWKLQEKAAAESDDAKREKLEEKAVRLYESAIQEFKMALSANPQMHQAFSSLGYALRKTGNYEDSLAAYNRALELAPGYTEAIEYRAEAYLGLDRLEDAKSAYMQLFNQDRERSDELLTAMKKWVETRRAEPAGVAAEKVEEFARWIDQRGEIAGQTSALYGSGAAAGSW